MLFILNYGTLVVPENSLFNVFAFKFNWVAIAVETILFASLVLSTLAKLTIAFVIPPTVPVNVGLARGALTDKAFVMIAA